MRKFFIVMMNDKGKLKVVDATDEEKAKKEIEKLKEKGFVVVDTRYDYEKYKYKVFFCKYHKRYEVAYDTDIFMQDLSLKIVDIVKDCRFLKYDFNDSVSVKFEFYSFGYHTYDYIEKIEKKILKIVKMLYKTNKTILYFFLNYSQFTDDVIDYFRRKNLDKIREEEIKKLFDKFLQDYIDLYSNPFDLGIIIYLLNKIHELNETKLLENDEIVKKHYEKAKEIVLRNLDAFFDYISKSRYVDKKKYVLMVYNIFGDAKILKYLL